MSGFTRRLQQASMYAASTPSERPTNFGQYRPDNTNTGITSDRAGLTQYNYPGTSAITLSSPSDDGRVFENLEIYGDVNIGTANNVTFRNCLFRGPATWPTNDGAIVSCIGDHVGTELWDCTFAPQLPNYYRNAVIGHEYRAYRCRVFWTNDGFGVYTQKPYSWPTNVEVAGCYVTDLVYWHGDTSQYPGQSTANMTVTLPSGSTISVPPYPIKADGSHNDGIQVQGALGGSKSVWIHGNFFDTYDADPAYGHPLGWSDPLPTLGSQDCVKRYTSSGNLQPMYNGRYSNNGQAIIIQQNVNQFPQADTVVAEYNWLNSFGQNSLAKGSSYSSMQCTFQYNKFGASMYYYVPTNPSTYPIRIDSRAGCNVIGLDTNTWYEGYWEPIGSVLTEGRTSGIRYDS